METGQWIAGRYRLDQRIGSGAGGSVWRAHDTELDRVVAVKCAHTHGEDHIAQLRREARLLARFNHPHVVTVFDRIVEDGQWCIVMELLSGSLADRQPGTPVEVARIGRQIAEALDALHRKGITHGDVKRGNVLLTADGVAKLSDFGVSRAASDEESLSGSVIYGTPGYIAPEVALGEKPTAASDMYSLGATLYFAVEGHGPFGDVDNRMLLLRKAVDADIVPPVAAGSLGPLLTSLLNRDPARRPEAALAARFLGRVGEGGSEPTTDPVSEPVAVRRGPRLGGRAVWWGAGALAVVVAVGWAALQFPLGGNDADLEKAPVMGDAATADPCSLLSAKPFDRFGRPQKDAAYGNFNRCDVLISSRDGDADVRVELARGDLDEPGGKVDASGAVDVVRNPEHDGACARQLMLADDDRVDITAEAESGSPKLCAMADTAVHHALGVLSHGAVPRRHGKPAASSLIRLNACDLLNGQAVKAYPGVDPSDASAGFGDWECRWHNADTGGNLLIGFDQSTPLSDDDGEPLTLAGHVARLQPEGYGPDSCQVSVSNRQYRSGGERIAELVRVVVMGHGKEAGLCSAAKAVARPVAAEIPGS